MELKPHQLNGVAWVKAIRRGILADDPGLGKTATAIVAAVECGTARKVVVLPSNLAPNWRREIKQWAEEPVFECDGKPRKPPASAQWILVSYARLGKWAGMLKSWCADPFLIFDESHELRGVDSKRSADAMRFCRGVTRILMLTGTPFVNHPAELLVQLQCLRRLEDFGGSLYFKRHFCSGRMVDGRMVYGKPKQPEVFHRILKATCMLRRTKEDIGGFTRKLAVWNNVNVAGVASHLEAAKSRLYSDDQRLSAARWAVGVAKIPAVVARAQERIDAGDRVLIFAHHQDVTEGIAQRLECPRINGNIPPAARQQIVDRFQKGHHDALVVSWTAGGVGLNLQRANAVLIAEYPWHPAAIEQGADRAHRIGQQDDVEVEWIHAVDTVDEHLVTLIAKKASMFNAAVEGEQFVGMVADAMEVSRC